MQWNKLIAEAQAACEINDIDTTFDKLSDALLYLDKYPHGEEFVVETLRPLVELLWTTDKQADCFAHLVRLLGAEEKVYGAGSLETNVTLTRLSELTFNNQQFVEAEAYGRKSFAILQRAYGDDCLEVAIAAHVTAVLHQSNGSFEASELMYKRALTTLTKLGADANEISAILTNYASLLRTLHRHEEADHLIQCSSLTAA